MADHMASLPARLPGPDKRTAPRIAVALPVLIGTWEGQHRARLHNISRGGARIEAAVPVRAGCQVQFSCGTIETRGTVVWQDSDCFGVSFPAPVDEVRIVQQVARSEALARHRESKEG